MQFRVVGTARHRLLNHRQGFVVARLTDQRKTQRFQRQRMRRPRGENSARRHFDIRVACGIDQPDQVSRRPVDTGRRVFPATGKVLRHRTIL